MLLHTAFNATRANQNPMPSLHPVITAVGIMRSVLNNDSRTECKIDNEKVWEYVRHRKESALVFFSWRMTSYTLTTTILKDRLIRSDFLHLTEAMAFRVSEVWRGSSD